jgi:hypothetical protein
VWDALLVWSFTQWAFTKAVNLALNVAAVAGAILDLVFAAGLSRRIALSARGGRRIAVCAAVGARFESAGTNRIAAFVTV